MPSHTSGPWKIVRSHPDHFEIGTDEFFTVARVRGFSIHDAEANARLIAAAPDLLAACEALHVRLFREQGGQENSPWAAPLSLLADAIAKAKEAPHA